MTDRCEPPEGFEMVGCCVQNSAPPAVVRELVEALDNANRQLEYMHADMPSTTALGVMAQARAALHRAKEAGVWAIFAI